MKSYSQIIFLGLLLQDCSKPQSQRKLRIVASVDSAGGTFGRPVSMMSGHRINTTSGDVLDYGYMQEQKLFQVKSIGSRSGGPTKILVLSQSSISIPAAELVVRFLLPPTKYPSNSITQVFLLLPKVIQEPKIMVSRTLRQLSATDLIQLLPTHCSTASPLATTTSFQK